MSILDATLPPLVLILSCLILRNFLIDKPTGKNYRVSQIRLRFSFYYITITEVNNIERCILIAKLLYISKCPYVRLKHFWENVIFSAPIKR